MKLLLLLACGLAAVSTASLAASPEQSRYQASDADVCYSPPSADVAFKLTSATSLTCPRAGNHSLPQLVQAGWSIVSVQPVVASMADPTHPQNQWMVVLQKH